MSWWNRKRRENDLDRELASHLDLESEEQREAGVPANDAGLAARRAFGNPTLVRESTRSAWGWTSVESIAKDLRFALRMLRKNPGFSAIAVFALALGIGVNTSVFTLVNSVLLRPLPFPHPEQLMRLWDSYGKAGHQGPVSYPNFVDWRAWSRSFSGMAAFTGYSAVLTGGEPMHLQGMVSSANLFQILGVQPALGRDFLPEEDRRGGFSGANRIILSHRLWQDRLGRDPAILGRTLVMDGQPYSVIGVMPAGFETHTGIASPDFWVTAAVLQKPAPNAPRAVTEEREMSFLNVIARLKPGITATQAQADMDRVAALLMKTYPQSDDNEGVVMRDLQESGVGDQRSMLLLLLGAAAVVFLIACADVSGLVLARSTRRQREMTVRAALGAGRWRIVRQLLAESLLLSIIGGAAGVVLAAAGADLLTHWLQLGTVTPRTFDPQVLGFAFLAAALAAIVFSMAPALHASKSDLVGGLKESALSSSESRRQKFGHGALVVGQIALAMALLSSSAVLTLSLLRMQNVNLGFQPEHALTFPMTLPSERYRQGQRAQFFQELLSRLQSLPGVQFAGAAGNLPLGSGISNTVLSRVSGRDIEMNKRTGIAFASVTPQYFQSMGIAVKRGRAFTGEDSASSQPVVIINEAASKQYFGDRDPVGQQVQPEMWNGSGSTTRPRTVVGVVSNVKMRSVRGPALSSIYWPIAQIPSDATMFVAVRTAGDPSRLVNAIRTQLSALDANLPLYDAEPMDQVVSESLARPRDVAALVSLFALLALTLTAVGLYGVIAYSVTRRTREIGVRIALGAKPEALLRSVVLRGLYLSLAGSALGLPVAIFAARFFRTLLFEVSPQNPWTLAAGAGVLIAVALLASYIPARRAARVDPMVALRYQ